jgi:hypothetical protein
MKHRPNERRRWLLGLSLPALVVLLAALALAAPPGHQPVRAEDPSATPTATATPAVTPAATDTATPADAATPTPAADAATPTPAASAATATPAAAATSATPVASATPAPADDNTPDVDDEETTSGHAGEHGGGGSNVVQVINRKDDRLRVRGSIQINHIPGDDVSPLNEAIAYGQCDGCQTIAVALQIDLVSRNATSVTPQNYAYAINYQCTGCTTVARALQYVIPVDDPNHVPDEVRELQRRMDDELRRAAHDPHETLDEAEMRVNTVISQFQDLANSLYDQRDAQSQ